MVHHVPVARNDIVKYSNKVTIGHYALNIDIDYNYKLNTLGLRTGPFIFVLH